MRGRRGSRSAERPPEAANGGADLVDRKKENVRACALFPIGEIGGTVRPRGVVEPHGTMGGQKERKWFSCLDPRSIRMERAGSVASISFETGGAARPDGVWGPGRFLETSVSSGRGDF